MTLLQWLIVPLNGVPRGLVILAALIFAFCAVAILVALRTQEGTPEKRDLSAYEPESLPEHLRWKGEGPPPAYWYVGGTKVYRSYADYCDD